MMFDMTALFAWSFSSSSVKPTEKLIRYFVYRDRSEKPDTSNQSLMTRYGRDTP
jgi:hypothetical protein